MTRRRSKYIHDPGCDVTTHDTGVCLCTPPYPLLRPMIIHEHHHNPSIYYRVTFDGVPQDLLETLDESQAIHWATNAKKKDPSILVNVEVRRATFFRVEYNRAWADHGRIVVREAVSIADAASLPNIPLIEQMGITVNKCYPLTDQRSREMMEELA